VPSFGKVPREKQERIYLEITFLRKESDTQNFMTL
jgi:hypothetical protein